MGKKNMVLVIGTIWLPADTAAMEYNPSTLDVENMRDDNGEITRESVALWLDSHSGYFQSVDDFDATLITADGVVVYIPWEDDENGCRFSDLMYPEEY